MKSSSVILASLVAATSAAPAHEKRAQVYGFDISHYQESVDFDAAYNDGGLRFVYIKATEGLDYLDPLFSDHYTGATDAGFIRGGYHFAHGDESATDQADFFAENGGGWTDDGITLPGKMLTGGTLGEFETYADYSTYLGLGMLDLEGDCASVEWIQEFSDEYHSQTGRYPVLYSSPSWWEECTGNSDAFIDTNPLDMACWDSEPCTPQGSWPVSTSKILLSIWLSDMRLNHH